jgi:hypothetical protein
MWQPVIPHRFTSRIVRGDDEAGTGKWLVPVGIGDPQGLWTGIREAAADGRLTAAKLSSPRLDDKLGHHLACVYCADSRLDTVERRNDAVLHRSAEIAAAGATVPV